jgi:hypothetical protein
MDSHNFDRPIPLTPAEGIFGTLQQPDATPTIVPPGTEYAVGPQDDELFSANAEVAASSDDATEGNAALPDREVPASTAMRKLGEVMLGDSDEAADDLPSTRTAASLPEPDNSEGMPNDEGAIPAEDRELPIVDDADTPAKADHIVTEARNPEIPAKPLLSPEEVVRRFNTQGYVRDGPVFQEQVQDKSPQGVIAYHDMQQDALIGKYKLADYTGIVTERAALDELRNFLTARAEHDREARRMLESLTFTRNVELNEAAAGWAAQWNSYLDSDKQAHLYVETNMGPGGAYKSGSYVFDRILQHVGEDRLSSYAAEGRLHIGTHALVSPPENTLIAVVDDLVATGTQVEGHLSEIGQRLPREYDPSLEVNVVAAGPLHARYGAPMRVPVGGASVKSLSSERELRCTVPIKTYFLVPNGGCMSTGGAYATSSHSSPVFGFRAELDDIQQRTRAVVGGSMPKVYTVFPPYKRPEWRPEYINRLQNLIRQR